VTYGETIADDLVRRDFTVNAMAVRLPDWRAPDAFVDLHGGLDDLAAGVLRTPGTPEESFGDDPLRMLRAARFAAQLGFRVAPEVVAAMRDMAGRLEIISVERINDELSKLLCAAHPRAGLELLVDTGLAEQVLPELPALRLEIDEHHQHKDVYEHTLQVLDRAIALEQDGPDLVLRLAALLHDIGKPRTRRKEAGGGVSFHHHEVVGASMARKRLTALRYPKDVVAAVVLLTELHLRFHGYRVGGGQGQGVGGGRAAGGRAAGRAARGPTAPCAATSPTPAPARAAAQAGPLGLHDAQPAPGGCAGGGVRRPRGADRGAGRAGGARADPSRPGRHRIMELLQLPPGRSSAGVPPPARAADGARAAARASRRWPSCAPGRAPRGWPSPSRTALAAARPAPAAPARPARRHDAVDERGHGVPGGDEAGDGHALAVSGQQDRRGAAADTKLTLNSVS
jgi:putative nucleotidyltransferase with HDIG domain